MSNLSFNSKYITFNNKKITTIVDAGTPYDSDLVTYWTGLSTPLSTTQKDLLQTFVVSLKNGMGLTNLSDAFDTMYILANETEEAGLRNLVKRSHDATNVNTTTFTQYEGFQSNGTTSYLNSNYNPSTNGVNYTDDSASFGVYFRTPRGNNTGMIVGAAESGVGSCAFYPFRNNTVRYYINDGTASTIPVYNNVGLAAIYRTSSTIKKASKNKVLGSNTSITRTGKPNLNVYLNAENYSLSPFILGYETSQISLGYTGRALTQSDINALYDSFEAYMNARNKGFLYFSYPSVLTDGSTVGWYVSDASSTTMYMSQDTSIYVWNDILGSGRDLIQATGSAQPQWTSDGVLFDGVNDYMKAAFTYNQPEQIYMVAKQVTWTSNDTFFDGGSGLSYTGRLYQYTSSPILTVDASGGSIRLPNNSNLSIDTWGIIRVCINGVNSKLQINNTAATTGDLGIGGMGGFTLASRQVAGLYGNIQVKEVILRNVADNATDEAAIYNYLANKYSIS